MDGWMASNSKAKAKAANSINFQVWDGKQNQIRLTKIRESERGSLSWLGYIYLICTQTLCVGVVRNVGKKQKLL